MNDNDRELIELAAKAYGIQVKGWLNDKLIGFDANTEWPVNGDWNPLESDGDAFRLAVYLGIFQRTDFIKLLGDLMKSEATHLIATRRAITLIAAHIYLIKQDAAEIGRGME